MPSNETEGREKALCLFGGFESPHFLFSQARGLVRIFRTIIQPFVLTVLHARQDFAFRRAITLQLISDDDARNVLRPFEKLVEKAFGSFLVASALHQNVQDIAVLIHGSPQVMFLATDREEDLVQMPLVAGPRLPAPQRVGIGLPELGDQRRMVSYETITPRSSMSSSTSRKLSGKRWYSHTQ
jgi:hypothetical protein